MAVLSAHKLFPYNAVTLCVHLGVYYMVISEVTGL
jgi:hypothetical protein